eukprot:5395367-Amphidinium_carterae.1
MMGDFVAYSILVGFWSLSLASLVSSGIIELLTRVYTYFSGIVETTASSMIMSSGDFGNICGLIWVVKLVVSFGRVAKQRTKTHLTSVFSSKET